METSHAGGNSKANKIWKLSSLPLDRRAIGSKWILIVKRDAQDNFEKFKARLIVQGFWPRIWL
jgi:hypothetical protein